MPLTTFDLRAVFACGAELAEASAAYHPEEHTAAANADRGTPDGLALNDAWHRALDQNAEAANRLKRCLGARGPLDAADRCHQPGPTVWDEFRSEFKYAAHPLGVRRALWKLANAAADLGGYAEAREPNPVWRERGVRLLRQGLAQLWGGLDPAEREGLRPALVGTHESLGWPPAATADPPPYDGPDEIDLADRYRVVDMTHGFSTRDRDNVEAQQHGAAQGLEERARSADAEFGADGQAGQRQTTDTVGPDARPPAEQFDAAAHLANLLGQVQAHRQEVHEWRAQQTDRARRRRQQRGELERAFEVVWLFPGEERRRGNKPGPDGFGRWAERLVALAAALAEYDRQPPAGSTRERLVRAARSGVPALEAAAALVLLAYLGDAPQLAQELEALYRDPSLRRFAGWLPYILDNLSPPEPDDDGIIRPADPPDGVSLADYRKAEAAFGWKSLLTGAGPTTASGASEALQEAEPMPPTEHTGNFWLIRLMRV
jgi:hypothetical protein